MNFTQSKILKNCMPCGVIELIFDWNISDKYFLLASKYVINRFPTFDQRVDGNY